MRSTAPIGSRTNGRRPLGGRKGSLRIIGGFAGLLGAGITAVRFVSTSPSGVIYVSISVVVCAIVAGTVAIASAVVGRSPEVRRLGALKHLARKADSREERLSVMAMLSLATSTPRIGPKDTAELIRIVLEAPRSQTCISEPPPARQTPATGRTCKPLSNSPTERRDAYVRFRRIPPEHHS